MEQLQELKLDDPEAKTPAVYFDVFWNLEKLEKLEMLNTDLRVMQYQIMHLSNARLKLLVSNMPRLVRLDLGNNDIGDDSAEILLRLPSLTHLELSRSPLVCRSNEDHEQGTQDSLQSTSARQHCHQL